MITKLLEKLKINDYELYGNDMAKINIDYSNKKLGKLVLVTSINPTPFGEGKTTTSIGLIDSLNKIGVNAVGSLREPSMGPVFGLKGGASGGGYSQVAPMEDINLHFTGDIHAITYANNLISAVIDNSIFQGNELGIDRVTFNRCLDVNDRSLRRISVNGKETSFVITPASELMSIVGLSETITDGDDPSKMIELAEENNILYEKIYKDMTDFEKNVFDLKMLGLEYKEIASMLDKSYKSIDSALQRIRLKVKKALEDNKNN